MVLVQRLRELTAIDPKTGGVAESPLQTLPEYCRFPIISFVVGAFPPKGSPMKYLGLAYFTPEKFAAMEPGDVKELVSQCPALDEKMRATGKVLVSASLGDLDSWMTLRPRNGKTQVTDGPYAESKEVVGGLFIIEADSRDEALRIASMHPAATLGEECGWAIELIPMDFYLAQ
ncbi:MAG TPA: YciI family protein [Rhodanobacter sp.]|jgi:hypothetical protein|nr:YciI family protein [Rhodanobacter sp.]